jgi:deoxyribodipyrimidine photolyase-related protein
MTTAALVYPHQLFRDPDWMRGAANVYLVEDPLFFSQYAFHRQKLMLHRASMQNAAAELRKKQFDVRVVEAQSLRSTADIAPFLVADGHRQVRCVDLEDDYASRRLARGCTDHGLKLEIVEHPDFLTPMVDIERFTDNKSKLFFTQFYIEQRHRLGILVDERGKPLGGKWSFDTENRRRFLSDQVPPEDPLTIGLQSRSSGPAEEARRYVDERFPNAMGESQPLLYPWDRKSSLRWLDDFIEHRLQQFGDFEDAICREHTTLFHSVLTPMLNIGLLSPQEILERVLAAQDRIPLNSLEGFIRQVIGWREYMRLVYRTLGRQQRIRNYWQHTRPLPRSFYDGTTGIEPIDRTIGRVLRYGYCHHIERLMILGNFMLLCEFHPDAIYRWFMEMFVDAYDWVMVPNVYGMSQHADGGRITTKPYISGSSYVLKMSDFKKGAWCETWDALYWRFIDRHRGFFESNPRMKVMTGQLDRMGDKRMAHLKRADAFLSQIG